MTTIVTPDLDAIISEIHTAAPAERVFAVLTDPKQLVLWFTDARAYFINGFLEGKLPPQGLKPGI